jgi:hypothetical protein
VGPHENDSEFLVEHIHAHTRYIEEKRIAHSDVKDPPLRLRGCSDCGQNLATVIDAPLARQGSVTLTPVCGVLVITGGMATALLANGRLLSVFAMAKVMPRGGTYAHQKLEAENSLFAEPVRKEVTIDMQTRKSTSPLLTCGATSTNLQALLYRR